MRLSRSADDALQARLAKLGLHSDLSLALHLPHRYEDETERCPIDSAQFGAPVLVEGEVIASEVVFRPKRQLLVKVRDDTGVLAARFLNFYPNQQKLLAVGTRVRLFGEVRPGFSGGEMVHPRVRVLRGEEPLAQALTPVYPTTAGLSQQTLRKLIEAALERVPLDETLPAQLRAKLDLPEFAGAVHFLHRPPPDVDARALEERTHSAWRRIKFDELLAQQLSMRAHYQERKRHAAPALVAGALTRSLVAQLPFRLTRAQTRAWREIEADLALPHPMNRLLQGDVGSGKTVVAALAALRAVENGHQAAVMAPTELLAEQHYRKLAGWLAPLGVKVAWLTGSQKKAARKSALAAVAAGETAITVGTHALFQQEVVFERLALAVVDEQHRFGVRQRLALREKGVVTETYGAHQLMMSATPIPRTLSMSYYADLDVSVIDELPPGRTPVVTRLAVDTRRDEIVARIRAACAAGQQAYWVCPLIEESETLDLQTALDTHARLSQELAGLTVELLHGRMPLSEKSAVMEAFAAGAVQVLVATTVIEVGVDVANASLMVIEHAERFGLAQLHQLRGRVGRGAAESVCILLYQNPLSASAQARLKVIFEHTDGFRIAQEDLLLRGPGEYLGARQSGAPLLRFADLSRDGDLLEAARQAAAELVQEDPEAAARHRARWMADHSDMMKV